MKTYVFIAALLLNCNGCTPQESGQLDPQQSDRITKEVTVVADSIWAKWEQVNPEEALQYFEDSQAWVYFNAQGTRRDFQTHKEVMAAFKNSAASYTWTTTRRDFPLVTRDIVICSWLGKDEALWKSGEKYVCDPHAYTLVFKNIAGQWKLIYTHDSGIGRTQKSSN